MGRRARKKNQKRIEEVRRNYISHDEWGSDDFYLGIGRRELTRQEVIEPLPDPDEQLLDILQFAPGHNPIADIREAMEGMPEHIPPARWVIKMKYTGNCAICNAHLSNDFPDDFPDEYKFCCGCFGVANGIIIESKMSPNMKHILEGIERNPKLTKIYKRITLVDNSKDKWIKRNTEWEKMLRERRR